jgi:6,7-dimethyl-8-ribityllumazine synthase
MLQSQSTISFDKKFTKKLRIAIVRTNYYVDLLNNLEFYARKTLISAGVSEKKIRTFTVPGSWEVPLLVKKVAVSKKFDAILAFGVIIKGETYHFDMIATETASALMQMSLDYNTPVAFEILAVADIKHAQARANQDENNKGIEAANAALLTLQALGRV